MTFLPKRKFKGNTFEAAVSKLVMKLVRHYIIKKNEKLMVQFIGNR